MICYIWLQFTDLMYPAPSATRSDESDSKAQLHQLGKQPQLPWLNPLAQVKLAFLVRAGGELKLKQPIQLCSQICANTRSAHTVHHTSILASLKPSDHGNGLKAMIS